MALEERGQGERGRTTHPDSMSRAEERPNLTTGRAEGCTFRRDKNILPSIFSKPVSELSSSMSVIPIIYHRGVLPSTNQIIITQCLCVLRIVLVDIGTALIGQERRGEERRGQHPLVTIYNSSTVTIYGKRYPTITTNLIATNHSRGRCGPEITSLMYS